MTVKVWNENHKNISFAVTCIFWKDKFTVCMFKADAQYVLQLQNFHQGNLGRFFLADIPGRIGVILSSISYRNSTG